MDIISAHQQGLIEQLEDDVMALAGRARDHGQRAVVLHHLYDHSRGAHAWTLAEARRELHVARALAILDRRLQRLGWMIRGRHSVREALESLATALGEGARARCAAACLAYRLSSSPALRAEATHRLPNQLQDALEACHAARKAGQPLPVDVLAELAGQSEAFAAAAVDHEAIAAAWRGIDATGLRRVARRLLGDKSLQRIAARDRKRSHLKVEAAVRMDPMLPASFHANPAQHFYALQNLLAERRRQQWRQQCDKETDAFELAA